jgi:hypothetical protein
MCRPLEKCRAEMLRLGRWKEKVKEEEGEEEGEIVRGRSEQSMKGRRM